MATHVSIKNFQSIKSVDFTIDGFTVIVGKNNIGKSAIIRAIDNALKNEVGNEYLRKGTKESTVEITRDDIKIKWVKGDSAVYEITPTGGEKQVFSKLNRDVPQPLLDAGFERIQIEDKLVSPLIAPQFEPLFLLNKRGSVVTEVLTALYDMDLICIADDKCQKDLKSNKSSYKVREQDLKNLQIKLEKYKDFEQIKAEVSSLVEQEKICNALQAEIDAILGYEGKIQELHKSLTLLKGIVKVQIPDSSSCENLIPDLQWIASKEEELLTVTASFSKLKGIKKVSLPSTEEVEKSALEVRQFQDWDDSVKAITKSVEKQAPITTVNVIELSALLQSADKLIKDYKEMQETETSFLGSATAARTSRDELKTVMTDLEAKNKEYSQIKICPLCERPR